MANTMTTQVQDQVKGSYKPTIDQPLSQVKVEDKASKEISAQEIAAKNTQSQAQAQAQAQESTRPKNLGAKVMLVGGLLDQDKQRAIAQWINTAVMKILSARAAVQEALLKKVNNAAQGKGERKSGSGGAPDASSRWRQQAVLMKEFFNNPQNAVLSATEESVTSSLHNQALSQNIQNDMVQLAAITQASKVFAQGVDASVKQAEAVLDNIVANLIENPQMLQHIDVLRGSHQELFSYVILGMDHEHLLQSLSSEQQVVARDAATQVKRSAPNDLVGEHRLLVDDFFSQAKVAVQEMLRGYGICGVHKNDGLPETVSGDFIASTTLALQAIENGIKRTGFSCASDLSGDMASKLQYIWDRLISVGSALEASRPSSAPTPHPL